MKPQRYQQPKSSVPGPRSKFAGLKTRQWIDESGRFMFGKYRGKFIEHVAGHDSEYLCWILDKVDDIDEGDAKIIGEHLARKGG